MKLDPTRKAILDRISAWPGPVECPLHDFLLMTRDEFRSWVLGGPLPEGYIPPAVDPADLALEPTRPGRPTVYGPNVVAGVRAMRKAGDGLDRIARKFHLSRATVKHILEERNR